VLAGTALFTRRSPHPTTPCCGVVVGNAIASVRGGEASVEEAILHAAVHGWYEGHVQGEDECSL
jgi:hypothetical protein